MKVVLSVLLVASLAACATHSPDVIHPYEAQRLSQLSDATVLSVRPVTIDGMPERRRRGRRRDRRRRRRSPTPPVRERLGRPASSARCSAAWSATRSSAARRTQNAVELLLQMRNGERRVDRPGKRQRRLDRRRAGRARHHRRPDPGDAGAAGRARSRCRSRCRRLPGTRRCRRRCRCIRNPARCRRAARAWPPRRGGRSSASPSVSSNVRRILGQAGPPAST